MTAAFPTILVARRPRRVNVAWTGARSWLGGAPRIGSAPWPRDSKAQPLVFVAQIDLAEVAAQAGKTPLPKQGALAFFLGREAAVMFVPEGESGAPVMPPTGTPDLLECGAAADWSTDLAGRPLFPYWPIDFTVLDVAPPPDDDDEEALEAFAAAEAAAVERHFSRREYILTASQAFAGPPIPDWWQTAIHYADHLAKAARDIPTLVKRQQDSLDYARGKAEEARSKSPDELKKAEAYVALCERKMAALHREQPAFLEFAAEVSRFSSGRDPWALMDADELARLAALWARNPEFATFHFNQGKFALDYLKSEMFKALPMSDTPAFAAFPGHVRQLLDQKRAPRPQWWFTAIHYAKRLREAAAAGKRQSAERESAFAEFVEETSSWVQGRDPWSFMPPGEVEQLQARMKRAREEFREFAGYRVPDWHEELETSTLVAMASADDRGYAALPEAVRELINRDYLLPIDGWHQMFGRGIDIQGGSSAMREDGYIMLLQLTHDDLMHWSFGDNGVYQFWISPDDLARRNWAAVKMTFECH